MVERQAIDFDLIKVAREIGSRARNKVQSGPFAGLQINPELLPVHVAPKLLGTYESEIHEVLERLILRDPHQVINVGCAEGYYAAGLAMRLPYATVEAFDADPKARKATEKNAILNDLGDRVRTHGILLRDQLEKLLSGRKTLLVVDCEGGEVELLDPRRSASLCYADILVELHPGIDPMIPSIMTGRFCTTHAIEVYEPMTPVEKADQAPAWVPDDIRFTATDERRDRNLWMAMFAHRALRPTPETHTTSPRPFEGGSPEHDNGG